METKTNQYTVITIHFQQTGSADFECHDIVLKGIVNLYFSSCHLGGGECLTLQETCSGKSLPTGITLRENLHLLHIFFSS